MKKNNQRGFTMAEMLSVVAIIGVLAGVTFIAVQNHQRSMAQLERDTIAKEIYFAAQNHLTMAESQGYLTGTKDSVASTFFGTEETADNRTSAGIEAVDARASKIYYVVVNGGTSFSNIAILDLMLPFGSIDETVRAGGSYIIRYQANPAIVLDVFYCSTTGQPERFNHTITSSEYSSFLGYKNGLPSTGYVVGWYGGAGTGEAGTYLETPVVEVTNAEKLTVTVKDYNKGDASASIKLIVKNYVEQEDEETHQAAFILDATNRNDRVSLDDTNTEYNEYTIILDDITMHSVLNRGWHFADLNDTTLRGDYVDVSEEAFKPGEDIVVVAVSYSNSALTNIAYSNEITTNSLYADLDVDEKEETATDPETGEEITTTTKSVTAIIDNIRHLENLDKSLSGWDVDLTNARQIEDLDWNDFVTSIGKGTVSVCKTGNATTGTKTDCYLPVSNTTALLYDGNHKKISNIKVDTTTVTASPTAAPTSSSSSTLSINAGGVFGTLAKATIKNLELSDTIVTLASGDVGALAGTLTGTTVENVVAYHTDGKQNTAKITTASGNAGGLIGSIASATSVSKSAAALIVSATGGDAGGLIGTATGGSVTGCYSGGHTINSTLTGSNAVVYDATNYNVTATASGTTGGVAGGLIGSATATEITYCYSTCSATGATVGGLIGTGSGAITNSYCTGLVKSTATTPVEGAFAGNWTYTGQTDDDGNWYFDIINEREEKDSSGNLTGGYTYLYPVPSLETVKGLTALDESAEQFSEFCGASSDWKTATPYNDKLKAYYGEGTGTARVAKFNLKTIEQLVGGADPLKADEDDTTEYFVATHHGDWPAPEIFVINTAS